MGFRLRWVDATVERQGFCRLCLGASWREPECLSRASADLVAAALLVCGLGCVVS